MEVLISFCNQPGEPGNNLLLIDLKKKSKRYILDNVRGLAGLAQDKERFYTISQSLPAVFFAIDKISKKVLFSQELKEVKDPHQIMVSDEFVYIVSTGTDSVLRYKFGENKLLLAFDKILWKPTDSSGEKDTQHLNSITNKDGEIFISAFGKREIADKSASARDGYVVHIESEKKIITGIYHPHSLFPVGKDMYFCESAAEKVKKNEEDILKLDGGYLRGLSIKEGLCFVGVSNRRKISRSTGRLNEDRELEEVNESCKLVVFDIEKNKIFSEYNFFPEHQEIYGVIVPEYSRQQIREISFERLRKDLSFEQYGRYALIRDIINSNRENVDKFKVLDIGGRGNMMRKFLPDDDVFYLDPFVNSKDDNFIEGDGCKIPLENESFDWVVSADVFEHIAEDKRNKFIDENVRVAKLGVILTAPFDSRETVQAEKNVNESYKIVTGGGGHIWLMEHLENKLPDEKELESHLKSNKLAFQKIYHNWLSFWQTSIGLGLALAGSSDNAIVKRLKRYNYYYNSKVYPFDFSETELEPSYRRIYLIKKGSNILNLKTEKKVLRRKKVLEVFGKLLNLAIEVYARAENRENARKAEINSLSEMVQQKEKELKRKANSCKFEIQETTTYYQNFLKKEKEISLQKEQIIQTMKSSKFWKMRNKYIKLKNKLGMK
jgi:hypothetical protein